MSLTLSVSVQQQQSCQTIITIRFFLVRNPRRLSHSGLCDALVILKTLVVVDLVRMVRLILTAFEDGKQALVDADVLLLSLDHPDSLLAHLVDDAEDVDAVVLVVQLLQKEKA